MASRVRKPPGVKKSQRIAADAVRAWPRDRRLAVVCGGGPVWTRTVLGEPTGVMRVDGCGTKWLEGGRECATPFSVGHGAMEDVRAAVEWGARPNRERGARKAGGTGGWVASFSYELGEVIEPAAARKRARRESWPLVELWRVEETAEFDHGRGEWVGPLAEEVVGRGIGEERGFEVGELVSETGREAFEKAVARGVEYIRAGDVFQVNLAHRLRGSFSGSTREAFAALWERARPWHGAYIEDGESGVRRALMSASPELFLKVEQEMGSGQGHRPLGASRVMTRPMKGTRAGNRGSKELRESAKDAAELTMIMDLMRNDLGRVCRFGSVRVEEARAIELHGIGPRVTAPQGHSTTAPPAECGVWQGVGTVVGDLREGLDLVDLLCAAFPAGSVTGAPKIRAMQIIDELEAMERGPYCGSIGWIGDDGRVCLNVAIRTAEVRGRAGAEIDEIVDGEMRYCIGAGIVAESEPRREWEETMEKAGVVMGLGRCQFDGGANPDSSGP